MSAPYLPPESWQTDIQQRGDLAPTEHVRNGGRIWCAIQWGTSCGHVLDPTPRSLDVPRPVPKTDRLISESANPNCLKRCGITLLGKKFLGDPYGDLRCAAPKCKSVSAPGLAVPAFWSTEGNPPGAVHFGRPAWPADLRYRLRPSRRQWRRPTEPRTPSTSCRSSLTRGWRPLTSRPTISRLENCTAPSAPYRMGRELATRVVERHAWRGDGTCVADHHRSIAPSGDRTYGAQLSGPENCF